jgi:2-oxoglutarate ferredoxin oxidoreductase subunit delta
MARKGTVVIDRERCKGCLLCVRACPVKTLEADVAPNASGSYPATVRGDKCIACANCFEVCPDVCISVYEIEGDAA